MYYRQYYSLIIYQIHIASADEADALSTLATAAAATPCALLLLLLRIVPASAYILIDSGRVVYKIIHK